MTVEPHVASARQAPDFIAPYKNCDLVMKGGITSGVVYPRAVIELARRRYRFRSIGGTSAGAIAAAATAAAEYGRQREIARLKAEYGPKHGDDLTTYKQEWVKQESGFYELDSIVDDLTQPGFLANLFQPSPQTRPLFNVFLEYMITMAHRRRQRALQEKTVKLEALQQSHDLNELDAPQPYQRFQELEREVKAEQAAVKAEGKRLRLRQEGGRPGLLIRGLLRLLRGSWADHARAIAPLLYLHNRQRARGGNVRGLIVGSLAGVGTALLLVGVAWLLMWLLGVGSPVPPAVAPATLAGALVPLMLAGMLAGAFLGWQIGAPARVMWLALTQSPDALRGDLYGMCTGRTVDSHREQPVIVENSTIPGLTNWLADKIDRAAGMRTDVAADTRRPLTFGELRRPTAFPAEPSARDPDEPFIELKMVTTDLSRRQPYVLPTLAGKKEFYFDEGDMCRLFPEYVVGHLIEHANREGETRERFVVPEDASGDWHIPVSVGGKARKLRRLPNEDDLPVVVGMRMSLSFPLLLSAVPLYTIRAEAEIEQDNLKQRLGQKVRLKLRPDHVEQHWFSDGGICSNFPIHFFDKWFPDSPTFGINLDELPAADANGTAPEQAAEAAERQREHMPEHETMAREQLRSFFARWTSGTNSAERRAAEATTRLAAEAAKRLAAEAAERRREYVLRQKQKVLERLSRADLRELPDEVLDLEKAYWERIHLPQPNRPGRPRWHPISNLWPFLWSILDTSLNYRDALQSNLPSYAERIVKVDLTSDEGGLNLNMDPKTIKIITEKGKLAGYRLLRTFSLEHHQWTRLRLLAFELSKQLAVLRRDIAPRDADPQRQAQRQAQWEAQWQTLEDQLRRTLKDLSLPLPPLEQGQSTTEWLAAVQKTPLFRDANVVQQLLIGEAVAREHAQERRNAGGSGSGTAYPYAATSSPWRLNEQEPQQRAWKYNEDDSLRLNLLLALIQIWGSQKVDQQGKPRPILGDGAPDRGGIQMRITPDL